MLAFIAGDSRRNSGSGHAHITKREIARAFDVKGEDKAALKRLIKDLEADGAVTRGRKVLARRRRACRRWSSPKSPTRDRDGELIARPLDWEGPGEAPRILVRRPKLRREAAPAPGLGARVLIRVEFDPDAGRQRTRL